MRRALIIICLILTSPIVTWAQSSDPCPTVTSKGMDFWFMFLYNMNINSGTWTSTRNMIVACDQGTNIHVDGPNGLVDDFFISGGTCNDQHTYGTNQLVVATPFDGGYHVTSQTRIQAYARNHVDNTQDIATLLPTSALGTHYIVQGYPSSNYGDQVGFVATEDNTMLTMTVPCNIYNTNITAGTTLTPTLMRGQAYLLYASGNGATFSGMEVTSNGKPFAMFQGGWNPAVPSSGSGRDHCYEQALPVQYWGTEFIVAGAAPQSGANILRITSAENSCSVTIDGAAPVTLNAGQTHEYSLAPSNVCHIEATKPVCVTLFLGSHQNNGNRGDPSSVIIPPLDRGICTSRFFTPACSDISNSNHYLVAICKTTSSNDLRLDGSTIPSANQTVTTVGQYNIHRITPTWNNSGHHTLNCSTGTFVAYAYGLGSWESYAYPLGLRLDLQFDTIEIYDTICQGQTIDTLGIHLGADITVTPGDIVITRDSSSSSGWTRYIFHLSVLSSWQDSIYSTLIYGDTIFYNGDTFTVAGDYVYIFTASNGCDSTITLHISYQADTIHLYDTVCQGHDYHGYGFTLNNPQQNTTLDRDTVENGEPHHYKLHLTVLPTAHIDIDRSIILGDTLHFADTTITMAGTYIFYYTAVNGCDSMVTLIVGYDTIRLTADKDGVCPGEAVTISASGTHTFRWGASPPDAELDGQQGQNPITVHPRVTTVYHLLDNAGNIVASVTVGAAPAPTPCIEVNRYELDFDNPVLLFTDCSEGRHHSVWTFDDGQTFTGSKLRRQFRHPLPDSVSVTMTTCNRYNCCADTTIALPMKIRSVWFPNIFTPDAESNNLFGCHTSYDVAEFHMVIFNRWGLELWSTEDINTLWDGRRADGTPCLQGAYVYRYWLTSKNNDFEGGTGTVTLIR